MAFENFLGSAGSMLNVILVLLGLLVFAGILGVATWQLIRYKRYKQYICRVFEKDGLGNTVTWQDDAGVFVDSKTKNKRFFMKKANVGMEVDNIPYIYEKGKKVVYMLRDGFKNFHFIKIAVHNPNIELKVTEEDVNWALNSYQRAKSLFSQSLLMQLLPFALLAFVSIIILVIFIYFFKSFDSLKETAAIFKEMAIVLRDAKAGTTVITP